MRFHDIKEHGRETAFLRRLADEGRLPHALLLHGSEGTGKLAVARALAQYIHCTNHTADGDSCGTCPSCRQHAAYNHPDMMYSYPISEKGTSADFISEWKEFLEQTRYETYSEWQQMQKNTNSQPMIYATESDAIIHKLNLSAYSSQYKIVLMWLPEKMNTACANKLLKIIEEPHDDTIMLFVSDNPAEILPTIYSRTQRVEIRRLTLEDIATYLTESEGIDPMDAAAIAAGADGSMNNAINAVRHNSENKEFFDSFVDLMRKSYMRDFYGLKAWTDTVAGYKREKARRFLQYSSRLIRENFIYNLQHPELVHLTREEAGFSTNFARFINERNVEEMIAEFNRAYTDIKGNGNATIVLFDMSLKITKLIRK